MNQMATMDHRREIEHLRGQIAGLLSENPPRRQRAKEIGFRLNRLIQLQLKRENKIVRKLNERRSHAVA